MGIIRATYRLLGFILGSLLWIIGFGVCRIFFRDKLTRGIQWRTGWLKIMLPFLGIRTHVAGKENLPNSTAVYVANHRSYIEPVVALGYAHAVIVAKAEIARWPLIGQGAGMAGVIFVKRSDKESRNAALDTMDELVRRDFSLLVFPEGTTTKVPEFLPFRPGSFRLAAEHHLPVVPIAFEFDDPDDAWIGDDTFIPHFFRTFRKKNITVRMSIGPSVKDPDGMVLMEKAHQWIEKELVYMNRWVMKI